MKKVLFIFVHNSCRSQIAEALCKKYRKDFDYNFGIDDSTDKNDEEFIKAIMNIKYKIMEIK